MVFLYFTIEKRLKQCYNKDSSLNTKYYVYYMGMEYNRQIQNSSK